MPLGSRLSRATFELLEIGREMIHDMLLDVVRLLAQILPVCNIRNDRETFAQTHDGRTPEVAAQLHIVDALTHEFRQ